MGKGALIFVIAAVLGGSAMIFSSQQASQEMDARLSQGHESQVIARELARSGMNMAVGRVHRDWDNAVTQINETLDEVELEGGVYEADATQLSPTAVALDVTATFGAQEHEMRRTLVMAGPLDGAYVVDAPQVDPTFNDATFMIDGTDHRPLSAGGSLPSTAMHKPGIKTSSVLVRNRFGSALAGRLNRVRGVVDDSGTVGSGSLKADNNWEVDLDALYDEAVNHPDKQVLGGTIDGSMVELTYGSPSNPIIAYVPSSTVITGEVTGYGLLVIDGNLTVLDDFTWEGIVMVRQDTGDLSVSYGGNATIYGSLIALQRNAEDWAFTMPTDGRVQVTYKYSSAGFGSEVWIDPWGMSKDLLFERGSNRTGDQMDVYETVYRKGQRMNFFINVQGNLLGFIEPFNDYWNQYAAGNTASDGTPYAEIEQLGQYKWEIRFEDLPETHPLADWDYNDQVIEVEIIPEDGVVMDDDPWWTEDNGDNTSADSTSTGDDEPAMGDTFYSIIGSNARVLYSAEAIARLGMKLDVIRDATRIVVVDQWEGRPDEVMP